MIPEATSRDQKASEDQAVRLSSPTLSRQEARGQDEQLAKLEKVLEWELLRVTSQQHEHDRKDNITTRIQIYDDPATTTSTDRLRSNSRFDKNTLCQIIQN